VLDAALLLVYFVSCLVIWYVIVSYVSVCSGVIALGLVIMRALCMFFCSLFYDLLFIRCCYVCCSILFIFVLECWAILILLVVGFYVYSVLWWLKCGILNLWFCGVGRGVLRFWEG